MALLSVDNIFLKFKHLAVLIEISFTVEEGRITSLIGPNGAGKTSMLNCISGRYTPTAGEIYLDGKPLSKIPTHRRTELGLSRTFQNLALFKGLSVLDNLLVGRHRLVKYDLVSALIYAFRARAHEDVHRRRVEEIIDFLNLSAYRHTPAGMLPYGVQKRVELGRALAAEPRLILLDEPMAGLNLEETEDMARYIIDVNEEWGATVLLVEHDMGVVMELSDKVVALNFGTVLTEGSPEAVSNHPDVVAAYLGAEESLFSGR